MRIRQKAVIISCVLFLMGLGTLLAQTVDMSAVWPKGDCLKKGSDPKIARLKLVGPGRLEIHLSLDPYRNAGKMAYVPVVWQGFKNGKATGWGDVGIAIKHHGYRVQYRHGTKEARSWIDGLPWTMDASLEVDPGEYDVAVQLAAPAVLYGCGVTQWAQKARLVVTYGPGGPGASATLTSISGGPGPATASASSASSTTATTAAADDIAGKWLTNMNGYGGLMEITRAGSGLVIKLMPPPGQSGTVETLTEVGYDAATGSIKFTRPIQGYPAEMFVGKFEGGKLSGTFGFAPKTTGFLWSATRVK
jgi:hypothetical protein